MLKKLLLCLATPAVMFLSAGQSHAAVVYQYQTDKPSYTMDKGATMQVQFFLKETLSGASSSIIVKDGGLATAGMQIDRVQALPASPSVLTSLVINGADFKGPSTNSNSADTGSFSVAIGPPTNPPSAGNIPVFSGNTAGGTVTNPAANNSIYLGSATITAGSAPGTTTFSLHSIPGGGNTLTNNNFYDLDADQTGNDAFTGTTPFTFSVTVPGVPEPTSIGLIGVAGTMLLARRRRMA